MDQFSYPYMTTGKTITKSDKLPNELWMEVCDIVQEAVIKTIPPKKEMQKSKNGYLRKPTIAVKRREVKSKGEKERYTHLDAEFLKIARRNKKAFLSDQCKEIEEVKRMGKTRKEYVKAVYFHPAYLTYM